MGDLENFRMRGGVEPGDKIEGFHIADSEADDEHYLSLEGELIDIEGWGD